VLERNWPIKRHGGNVPSTSQSRDKRDLGHGGGKKRLGDDVTESGWGTGSLTRKKEKEKDVGAWTDQGEEKEKGLKTCGGSSGPGV